MITQAQIEEMLVNYFKKVAARKQKPVKDVRLYFFPNTKNLQRFQVFVDEITKEAMVDIIPIIYRLVSDIIHKYVARSIVELARRNNIKVDEVNVIMMCDESNNLSLVLMDGAEAKKLIRTEELFEINTE